MDQSKKWVKPEVSQPHVKIVNPLPGERDHMQRDHADRLIRQKLGKYDHAGRLVRKRRDSAGRPLAHNALHRVTAFSGTDALPERAILPPSAAVLAKMAHREGRGVPLRPPVLYLGTTK